jgi:hypothetical protein
MADDERPQETSNPYFTATDSIRTVAKWLIGAYAAVGAALLAGLQLTGLGNLEGKDLVRADAAVVVAIAGIVLAVLLCARVLTPLATDVRDLGSDTGLNTKLTGAPILRGYAADAATLATAHQAALRAYHEAWDAPNATTAGSSENEQALAAQARLQSLELIVDDVLSFATWFKVDRAFTRAKYGMTVGGVMALVGTLAFAHLAYRDPTSLGSADATSTKLVWLSFAADEQAAWRPILGRTCDLTKIPALIIASDRDTGEVELVSLPAKGGCDAKHFTIANDGGVTFDASDVTVPSGLKLSGD